MAFRYVVRNFTTFGLLVCLSASAHALGLGEMKTHSTISEPFDADIALSAIDDTALNAINVQLANQHDFQQAGIERLAILDGLRFEVTHNRSDQPAIRIRSDAPIDEPFLNFLLQVDWPNGRLLREYTALLDPPVTTERQAPKIAPPASLAAQTQPDQAIPSGKTVQPASYTDEYGPVRARETLWSIAGRTRPQGVTMQQMLVALQRANPQAFIGGNINRLRKGQILRVPDLDAILELTPTQATAAFSQQLDAWSGKTNQAAPVTADVDSQTGQPQSQPQPVQPSGDQLRIATAKPVNEGPPNESNVGASERNGKVKSGDALNEQLLRARENAETARQETNILRTEIDDLQARLNDMQRLLSLKDQQLAQLQNNLQQTFDTDQVKTQAETDTTTPTLWQTISNQSGYILVLIGMVLLLLAWWALRRQQHAETPRPQAAPGQPDTSQPAPPPPVLDQPLNIEQAFQSVVNETGDNTGNEIGPAPPAPNTAPDTQEVEVKLDLARVYVEMGDLQAAQDILHEVQTEGSQPQKQQAADLLAQMRQT